MSTLASMLSLDWLRSRSSRVRRWEESFHRGVCAYQEGRIDEAERFYEDAMRQADRFAADDPRLTVSLSNLVGLYRLQGKHARAEPLCLRALSLKEQRLGSDHPDVASTLGDLAEIYRAQGKRTEADAAHRRALGILEKAIGPDFAELSESLGRSSILSESKEP